jgi:hypothetical protein
MRRDQEGRQRQEQTNHSGRHCGGFRMFDPMKEALRGRRFSPGKEVIVAVQNWLKAQPKNLRNAETGALKSKGITLKSDISFVSVCLQ